MKTSDKLKELIKEEVKKVLNEGSRREQTLMNMVKDLESAGVPDIDILYDILTNFMSFKQARHFMIQVALNQGYDDLAIRWDLEGNNE